MPVPHLRNMDAAARSSAASSKLAVAGSLAQMALRACLLNTRSVPCHGGSNTAFLQAPKALNKALNASSLQRRRSQIFRCTRSIAAVCQALKVETCRRRDARVASALALRPRRERALQAAITDDSCMQIKNHMTLHLNNYLSCSIFWLLY